MQLQAAGSAPARRQVSSASRHSSRGGSCMPSSPMNVRPSSLLGPSCTGELLPPAGGREGERGGRWRSAPWSTRRAASRPARCLPQLRGAGARAHTDKNTQARAQPHSCRATAHRGPSRCRCRPGARCPAAGTPAPGSAAPCRGRTPPPAPAARCASHRSWARCPRRCWSWPAVCVVWRGGFSGVRGEWMGWQHAGAAQSCRAARLRCTAHRRAPCAQGAPAPQRPSASPTTRRRPWPSPAAPARSAPARSPARPW
jgi:hypothetical protein